MPPSPLPTLTGKTIESFTAVDDDTCAPDLVRDVDNDHYNDEYEWD